MRQSIGNPVPPEYRAILIKGLSSLLSYLEYLKDSSCSVSALSWPLTMLQVEDRVLQGLTDPVGACTSAFMTYLSLDWMWLCQMKSVFCRPEVSLRYSQVLMAVVMKNLVSGVCAEVDRSPKLVGSGRCDLLSAEASLRSCLELREASWPQLEEPFQASLLSANP